MTTPRILSPDGELRETLVFSTNVSSRFFSGTMDADTVDMQISIRGAPFTSDPDLILFEGTSFNFPNPSVYPDGLDLVFGENEILVRSVSFSGAVSSPAKVLVNLIQDSDFGLIGTIPTKVYVEQEVDSVVLSVLGVEDPTFTGINFLASRSAGGGALGYQRINFSLVTDHTSELETTTLVELTAESSIPLNPDGTPTVDPLYLKVEETLVRSDDVIERLEDIVLTPELAAAITTMEQKDLVQTNFVKTYEIPETTKSLRTTYTVQSTVERKTYHFRHNRLYGPGNSPPTIPLGEFASLPATEPLYYVARAVFYDKTTQREIESPNTIEVSAKPVVISRSVASLPSITREDYVQNLMGSILAKKPELSLVEGSVTRDIFIDPVSMPLSNAAFQNDWTFRSKSFETLLQIDTDLATGLSIPVSQSAYKQALQRVFNLSNARDTQTLIDQSFDYLAAEKGIQRSPGKRSRGFVSFFTKNRPANTVFIPLGTRVASGSTVFVTTSDAIIDQASLATFFNPTTNTYSVDVSIQAQNPGKSGDLSSNQIRTIVDSIPGFSVLNRNRTFGGADRDTNLALATKARNALSSVDTGTEQGISEVVANLAGVTEATIVAAGDGFMQRDYDTVLDRHLGGKVDVWVRGTSTARVTDSFAFTFEVANDVQFVIIGNPSNLVFRSLDVNLSPENPIAAMLSNQALGLGLRNASTGEFFDLTGVVLLDYRTIQLSAEVLQPVYTLGNVLLGDYRYVTSSKFEFTRQPVNSVTSVVGEVTGALTNYRLVKPNDPALDGRSVRAGDYLDIVQNGSVPSGNDISILNEQHFLIGEFEEPLTKLGANPLTVRVFNASRTVEYRGPFDPSGLADYIIVSGTSTTPLRLRRTETTAIQSGESVLVDYSHAENFVVTYTTNQVIPVAQEVISAKTHLSSDVLVKESLEVPIDITATITFQEGLVKKDVEQRVLTNLTALINGLRQGSRIRPSDIVTTIMNTRGVEDVGLPIPKMLKSEGTQVVREALTSQAELLLGVPYLPISTPTVSVYLLEDALTSATSTGGGSSSFFRGVYQEDNLLVLRESDPFSLGAKSGQAYIIGNDGLSIPGYSDDNAIRALYPDVVTSADIAEKRKLLTGNRVMVSLPIGDMPSNHDYSVTYVVAFQETGSQTIQASSLEYFSLGNLVLTFVEDR